MGGKETQIKCQFVPNKKHTTHSAHKLTQTYAHANALEYVAKKKKKQNRKNKKMNHTRSQLSVRRESLHFLFSIKMIAIESKQHDETECFEIYNGNKALEEIKWTFSFPYF